jgi:hypothetical protein
MWDRSEGTASQAELTAQNGSITTQLSGHVAA